MTPEFAPAIVSNSDSKVTFKCNHATPMDLIRAVGVQTRTPIGIVLGQDSGILSKAGRPYDLEKVDVRRALLEAIEDTGYTLKEEDHVMVLMAGDLTSRQWDVLTYPYPDFTPGTNCTMVELGVSLTMWMEASMNPNVGFGGSIGGSTNDERFTVKEIAWATTEQIANRIVSLGSKGMWTLNVDPFPTSGALTDQIVIEPYQHYSNRPTVED